MITNLIQLVSHSVVIKLFIVGVVLDSILGFLRAVKFKEFNSAFGIDGAIRKCAMILCILFLALVDMLFGFNFAQYIPAEVNNFLRLQSAGVSDLFALIFIACEAVSVLKNLLLCGVPIPAKIYTKVASLLDTWTDELNDFDLEDYQDSKGNHHIKVKGKSKGE